MTVFDIIGGVLLILVAIGVIATVAMQEGSSSVSALGGPNVESNRNRGKTMNAMLSRATKFLAILFFAITILIAVVDKLVG